MPQVPPKMEAELLQRSKLSTQLRKYAPPSLWTAFSLSIMAMWPHAPGHISGIWWNYSILSITLGLVCLSVGRFFGARHPFIMPEIVLLAFSMSQAFIFGLFLPSGTTAAADEFLFAFDVRTFGANCDVVLAQLFHKYPAMALVCGSFYCALPLVVVLVYLALPNSREIRKRYCVMIGLTAVVVFAMYTVCPGAGPKFLFGSAFPYKTPDHIVPHVRFLPNVALNATPSGHLAWALLLLWVARRHCGKYCQYNCSVFVGFTILSTMGLGEHYLVDLILSVPFAAGMWALMQGRWPRTLGAFLAVVAWSCALRRGWALQLPLAAVWMACIATVAIPLCLIRGLQRRERTQVAVSVGMAAPA